MIKFGDNQIRRAQAAYNAAMAQGSPGNCEFDTDQYVALQCAFEELHIASLIEACIMFERTGQSPERNHLLRVASTVASSWDDPSASLDKGYKP